MLKYLNILAVNKATGLDGIHLRFVRDGASVIAGPLKHVNNISLIEGVVPYDLNYVRVVLWF